MHIFYIFHRWFVDNEIVPGIHGTEYRIRSISRTIHNKIVKCEVNNIIGKSEETETMDINCKWKIFYVRDLLALYLSGNRYKTP